MIMITDIQAFHIEEKTALTLGKFDGLHVGHQKLLKKVMKKTEVGLIPTVFTFDVSPSSIIDGKKIEILLSNDERRNKIENFGIEILIECPFTKEVASMDAKDFIREILVERCNVAYVAVGEDFRFGKAAMGDAQMLVDYSKKFGFEVEVIEKECWNGKEISSTLVREELSKGNMENVTELLGQPYFVDGEVVTGNQIGRTIGMPTANQIPTQGKILPPLGVYVSEVEYQGKIYGGVTNIGYKPTVTEEKIMGVETYLFDFDKKIYGENIRVNILKYLRPELKFASLEELKIQMFEDMKKGKKYLVDKVI